MKRNVVDDGSEDCRGGKFKLQKIVVSGGQFFPGRWSPQWSRSKSSRQRHEPPKARPEQRSCPRQTARAWISRPPRSVFFCQVIFHSCTDVLVYRERSQSQNSPASSQSQLGLRPQSRVARRKGRDTETKLLDIDLDIAVTGIVLVLVKGIPAISLGGTRNLSKMINQKRINRSPRNRVMKKNRIYT
jgi:hypothetical protein